MNANELPELDGSTLKWRLFLTSHNLLRLSCGNQLTGRFEVQFGMTVYAECFTALHEVKIREASVREDKQLKDNLSFLGNWNADHKLFIIDSQEGRNLICAGWVEIIPDNGKLGDAFARTNQIIEMAQKRPLWKNGPSIEEL